jgi:hypothetical protein
MTKTIFGKKLLMLATITVLVTGLTLAATFDDAEAKKAKTGEHKLKCKSIGSFFTPSAAGVFSSSEGKCSAGLGHVSSAAVSSVSAPDGDGCVTLSTSDPRGDFVVSKKGFLMLTSTGVQCFLDENGLPLTAAAFCTPGGPHTSTVTGTYEILGGLVKDTRVVGGEGTFTSWADHCAGDYPLWTAPHGNSFTTELEGTIVFPG